MTITAAEYRQMAEGGCEDIVTAVTGDPDRWDRMDPDHRETVALAVFDVMTIAMTIARAPDRTAGGGDAIRELCRHLGDLAPGNDWLMNRCDELLSLADRQDPVAGRAATWCPRCGPRVAVDEDGCCALCGSDATGPGSDQALAAIASVVDGKGTDDPRR